MKHILSIDIGAGSGRHILGHLDNGDIVTREVYRFSNAAVTDDSGNLVWDIEMLFREVVAGIKAAFALCPNIDSLAIDTWGVDYVLMNGDEAIPPCFAYRSDRTKAAIAAVHNIIPFDQLYARTGIQFQPFNTIYQLYTDKLSGRLGVATDFLMLPEYLNYRLTGKTVKEYTNATTTGLVNCHTRSWDSDIIAALDLPPQLFDELKMPSHIVGSLLPDIAEQVGGNLAVKLCASHDTASAFESIDDKLSPAHRLLFSSLRPPSRNLNHMGKSDYPPTRMRLRIKSAMTDKINPTSTIFISSGTWALMGVKLETPNTSPLAQKYNFTNEGGIGYIRFLKNLMGMWLLRQIKLQTGNTYDEIMNVARNASTYTIFNVNSPAFTAPQDMLAEVKKAVGSSDPLNSVYHSLAKSYADAAGQIEEVTGRRYSRIVIVGGGAKDSYLCQLIEQYSKLTVKALPIEATAIGNIKVQL
jgi:rhamnulokinase